MRKYWYYTFSSTKGFGSGVYDSDNGEFDIAYIIKNLCQTYDKTCIVQNWQEISSAQYEKLRNYFENQNK